MRNRENQNIIVKYKKQINKWFRDVCHYVCCQNIHDFIAWDENEAITFSL